MEDARDAVTPRGARVSRAACRAALLVLLGSCGVTGACKPPAAPGAVRLAATLPLSSTDARVADAWRRGYRRAVDEANRAGGLLLASTGRRVAVVLDLVDDRGDLAQAERAAEELAARGIHALLATPGAVRMAAQAAVASRYALPYIVPASAAADVLATEHPWVFAAREAGRDDEGHAYRAAREALQALAGTRSLDREALRRAFAASLVSDGRAAAARPDAR